MDWTSFIPAALTLFGSVTQKQGYDNAANASEVQAQLQKQANEFTAAQLDQRAGQATAIAQRQAIADKFKTDLVLSRQLAVAAASGGGASDPTIINLMAKTASVGAYQTAIDLYQGEEQERQLRLQAAAKRYEGDIGVISGRAKADAYRTSGTASLLAGAGSLFSKYGMGGAPTSQPGTGMIDTTQGAGWQAGNDWY